MFQYLLDYFFHKPASSPPPTAKTLPIELLMDVYNLMECPFEQFKLLQKVPELIELIKIDNSKDICILVLPEDGSFYTENMERTHSKLTLPILLPEGFDVTKYRSLNEPEWRKPELDKHPILAAAYQDLMNDIGGVLAILYELEGFHSTDFTDVTNPVPVYHRSIDLEFGAYVFNDSIAHDCQLYLKFFSQELQGIPHTLNIWKMKEGNELASLYKGNNDKVTVLDCISGITVEQPPEESLLKDRNMYATLNTPRFLRYHDLVGRQWFRSTSIFPAWQSVDLVPLQVEDSHLISVNVIIPSGFDEVCQQHKELQDIKAIQDDKSSVSALIATKQKAAQERLDEHIRTQFEIYMADAIIVQVQEHKYMASEGEGPLYGSRFVFAPAVHKVQRESLGLAPTDNNTITTSFHENLPFFVYQGLFEYIIPARLFRPINEYEDADLVKEEEEYLNSLFNDIKYLLTSKYIQRMSKTFKDHKGYDSYDSMKPTFIELAILGEHAVTRGHTEFVPTGRTRSDEEKIKELELFETHFKPFFEEIIESNKLLKGFKPPARYK